MTWLIFALIIIAALAVDFLIISGIYWVICWAFGLTFTWPIALAIWLITCVLAGIVRSGRSKS